MSLSSRVQSGCSVWSWLGMGYFDSNVACVKSAVIVTDLADYIKCKIQFGSTGCTLMCDLPPGIGLAYA